MTRLAGKIAFVTGGASGLGEAIARRFVAEGATVIIADIDAAGGAALAAELGSAASFVRLDVTSEGDWLAALGSVAGGRIDILVNNAGITTMGSIETLSLADFRTMLDIDLIGVFLGCKHAIPLMKTHGGSIINMSSMCGLRAQPDLVGYNAAKAAVTHLTRSVALHYAAQNYGIRANSVHPGAIHTPILDKVMAQVPDPKALYDGFVATHPVGRLGRPEEIAAIAVYLASDEAAFTTGAAFAIDGGSSL
jgi:3(or 17)beta-hydroxysteroid dehydrogenase